MSIGTVQTAAQTTIRRIAAFANADVVINDWSVLDQSIDNAPYVIIRNDESFRSRQDTLSARTTWDLMVTIVEAYTDDKTTRDNLRDRVQALVDEFNAVGGARSAEGADNTTTDVIRADAPEYPILEFYSDPQSADPVYIARDIIIEVREGL